MPVKGPVPWPIQPHTAAKHRIYREYLDRWFPILLNKRNGYSSATYAEGFVGPGVYSGDEPGSPIHAIAALNDAKDIASSNKQTRFLFIDDDPRCIERLRGELTRRFPQRPRPEQLMPVQITEGTCADKMESELEQLSAWGEPILAVLDSWGNAPVPHKLIRRLAENPSSEVIVTFLPEHFVRFVTTYGPQIDDVFGGSPEWRKVNDLASGPAKRRFLLDQYRRMLVQTGFRYVLDFEMVDTSGTELYLVFATTSRRGLQKMKESVWLVDQSFGIRFRDPRDEQDQALFLLDEPETAPLQRLILAELHRRAGTARVEDLRQFALFETVYREEHVIPALRELRNHGTIDVVGVGNAITRSTFVKVAATPAVP